MNIQHHVPMLSLDKLHILSSDFLLSSLVLYRSMNTAELYLWWCASGGPEHLYYILRFSLRKVIIQAMDVFAFPDKGKQP